MLLRRVARPMLAAIFIQGGIAALKSPQGHVQAAKPVLDAVTPVLEKATDAAAPTIDKAAEAAPVDVPRTTTDWLDDETLVKIDGGVKVVAGTMLALGKFPRLASTALAASLIPTTLAGHRFWEETDPEAKQAQQIHFFKNVGLLGGLLIAAADTEGKPSLAWRGRKAAKLAAAAAATQAASVRRPSTTSAARSPRRSHDLSGKVSGTARTSPDGSAVRRTTRRARSPASPPVPRGCSRPPPRARARRRPDRPSRRRRRTCRATSRRRRPRWRTSCRPRRPRPPSGPRSAAPRLQKNAEKRAPQLRKQADKRSRKLQKRAAKRGDELARRAQRKRAELEKKVPVFLDQVATQADEAGPRRRGAGLRGGRRGRAPGRGRREGHPQARGGPVPLTHAARTQVRGRHAGQ